MRIRGNRRAAVDCQPPLILFFLCNAPSSECWGQGSEQAFAERMLVIVACPTEKLEGFHGQCRPVFHCPCHSLESDAGRRLNAHLNNKTRCLLPAKGYSHPLTRRQFKAFRDNVIEESTQGTIQGNACDQRH